MMGKRSVYLTSLPELEHCWLWDIHTCCLPEIVHLLREANKQNKTKQNKKQTTDINQRPKRLKSLEF